MEKTLEVLRSLFAKYGLPRQVISDNGPQFTSQEFEAFMLTHRIKHGRSTPYHPASNREAKQFVQTFKCSLLAGKGDGGTMSQKLSCFLLAYRSTPHTTTGVSPEKLFLKRKIQTQLDLLCPSIKDRVQHKQAEQKECHDKAVQPQRFLVGQTVLVRNLREGPHWLIGVVVQQLGPVTYEVEVASQVWKRHADQLMAYKGDA